MHMLTGPEGPSPLMLGRRFARHWRSAAWVFTAVFLTTTLIVMLLPNKYQTHLKILVKNERVDPLVGADKQTQGILYVNEISEARINTEIQLLTSADVLRQVVARCHLATVSKTGRPQQERRDEVALRQLQHELTVAVVRGSNVIEASYESTDPRRAAEVLRSLSETYIASHRQLHGAPGSYEFFHQLSARYSAELASAEAEMAHFGQAHQIVTMAEQKSLALANVAHLESQMEESAAAAQRHAKTAGQLKAEIDGLPASVERQRRSIPNQASSEQLTMALNVLENKLAAAQLRYQPEERPVKELTTQIAQTQAAIAGANGSKAEELSMGADPAVDAARGEYLRVSADEAGAQAQTRELARQLGANRARLRALDAQSVTYKDLQRKVAELEELDDSYRKKSEEARMAELLDEGSISNLAIVEQPYQPSVPESPKRGLLLTLGFLWSLAIAVATAVGLELFTDRIHTPFELAQASGMPVLAAVPSTAMPPSYDGSFPELYVAMQRSPVLVEKRRA